MEQKNEQNIEDIEESDDDDILISNTKKLKKDMPKQNNRSKAWIQTERRKEAFEKCAQKRRENILKKKQEIEQNEHRYTIDFSNYIV
jgi:hypothetical protein